MATDEKISALPTASALVGTEEFPLVQSGSSKKGTFSGILKAYLDTLYGSGLSGLTAGRIAITFGATSIIDTASLLWDNTLKKMSIISAGTSGLAALVITGDSGTAKTQINDNGTVVIDADVTTGVSPLTVKYNGAAKLTVAAANLTTAAGLLQGDSIGISSGSLVIDSVATVRSRVKSYEELELCPGLLGGGGTFVEINNGTRVASGGQGRDIHLRTLVAIGGNGSYIGTPVMTVANLAVAATAGAGARAFVTDATSTTFLSAVVGGGSNKVPVTCDGTTWYIG